MTKQPEILLVTASNAKGGEAETFVLYFFQNPPASPRG